MIYFIRGRHHIYLFIMITIGIEALLIEYGYRLLFPLAIIEGPIVAVIGGFLVSTGYFEIWFTLLLLVFADVITDIFYFYVGRLSHKSQRIKRYIDKYVFLKTHLKTMNILRQRKPFVTLLLGKQAYTLSILVIISAGLSKISLKKFVMNSSLVSLLQAIALMIIGYIVGSSYVYLQAKMKYGYLIIMAVVVVILVLLYKRVGKYAAKQLEEEL